MDWYFIEENDDFLVPSDRESFDDVSAFSDEWRAWTVVAQSKNYDALPQLCRGLLYADEMEENAFQEVGVEGGSAQLDCCLRTSEESFECQTDREMQNNMENFDNIFWKHNFWDPWNSFLEVDMRNVENNTFEPLQMLPESMYRSLSFEDMSATMLLTDPRNRSVNLSTGESVNHLHACGIPLFAAGLSDDFEKTDDCSSSSCMDMDTPNGPVTLRAKDSDPDIEVRPASESKLVAADAEKPKCLEAAVLEELEDVILLLNEETRICFRDSLYRLASSSKQQLRKRDESRRTAETTAVASGPNMEEGVSSRADKSELTKTETNIIDRTIANLVFNQPFAGSSVAENPVLAS